MSRYALATLILQLLMLQPIVASPIGFRFSGVVSGFPPSPMPFGISIPAGSNVTGHFFYEPSSAATHLLPCSGECIGYRQQLPNGFGATFDGAVVRADEYVVVISDNVAGGGDKLDTVAIRFSNTLNLEVPLVVNGVSRPNSQFSVSMNAHQTLLPDARLPPTLNPVDYPASGRGGVLDNTSAAGIDLFFSVAVLEPIAPGDYNFDGTVDAMDYSTWKSEFGSTTAWAPDGNHNGQVDAGDYTIWRDRFDAVSENLSNLSVPEPHPLHFAFVVGALFFVARSSCRLPRSRSVLHSRTSGAHSAFTLLELLVALSVLAILVTLLLPAVQFARESARRSTCQTNLRDVGLAISNYESSQTMFPAGARHNTGTHGVSWWVDVAPYFEEAAVMTNFDKTGFHSGWALMHSGNGLLVNNFVISSMICPSSPLPLLREVGSFQLMMPSYSGISGATDHDGFFEKRITPCCVPSVDGQVSGGGLLIPNQSLSVEDVVDGLSKTITVGEESDFVFDDSGVAFRIDAGFPMGWIMGTSVVGTPPKYAAPYPAWNITTVRYSPNIGRYNLAGVEQARGPNNPLSSAHSGGVNVLLAGGSVQFMPDEIDLSVLKSLATRDDGAAP